MTQLWTILIEGSGGAYSRTFIFDNEQVAQDFRKKVYAPMTDWGYDVYHVCPQGLPYASLEEAIGADATIEEILEEEAVA